MIFSTLRFLSENKGGWALPDSATLTGLPSLRRGEIGRYCERLQLFSPLSSSPAPG